MLRPGKRLLLTSEFNSRFGKDYSETDSSYYRVYTPRTLERLIADSGLEPTGPATVEKRNYLLLRRHVNVFVCLTKQPRRAQRDAPGGAMPDIPVERRTYLPLAVPPGAERRPCPACGRNGLSSWYLRRDRERRVWRRWVCVNCQAHEDRPENESA